MSTVGDYVARIEGTCGAESDVIVVLKFEKKDEAITRILKKAALDKTVAKVIYDLTYENYSFRVYANGKIIFRGIKSKEALNKLLATLLL